MPAIEVDELIKSYDGKTVVDGVSFHVDEGEIFAILGPNGAGKTTTVESIAGLRTPDSGHIEVFGFDPVPLCKPCLPVGRVTSRRLPACW